MAIVCNRHRIHRAIILYFFNKRDILSGITQRNFARIMFSSNHILIIDYERIRNTTTHSPLSHVIFKFMAYDISYCFFIIIFWK